jgi:hypothetical protein
MSDLVIIEAAINGATSKTVNPNVPVTEDEIVADVRRNHCLGSGDRRARRAQRCPARPTCPWSSTRADLIAAAPQRPDDDG